ncbi:MAG: hypothetical protein NC311_05700 [Muribaculaceae bacterium]|nr:hypothetical protein [Muribaculaceae bacterium]
MAEFVTQSLMCQASRPTRVYRSVYDTESSSLILIAKRKFYSRKQYYDGDTAMLYISEAIDEDIPTGYWCPAATVRSFPIEEEGTSDKDDPQSDDGSVADLLMISIKGTDVTVYQTSRSTSPIPNGLKVGDQVLCDRKIEIDSNGTIETRYRISQVIGEDQTLVGGWILINRAIAKPNAPKVTFHNNSIQTRKVASYARVQDAGIMPLDGDDTTTTPQVNPNEVITADGTTITVPGIDTNGVDGDPNVVINTVDITTEEGQKALYEAYGYNYTGTADKSLMSIPIGRMLFVHGMPFQWTYITDRRGNSMYPQGQSGAEAEQSKITNGSVDLYGRTFARDIAANMPIAVFAPGKPKFMTSVKSGLFGYSGENDARNAFLPMFSDQSDTVLGSVLSAMNDIEGDYQYYSMEIDTTGYYNYVNSLCQTSARLMGLSKTTYRGKSCEDIDWGKYNSAAEQDFSIFESVMGLSAGVSFAFDPQSSISDTITNQTAESQFLSMFTDLGSKARELEFVLGYTGTGANELIDSANYVEQAKTELNSGAFAGLNNAVDRIGAWMKNTAHGMNIRFPELWSDSSHSPSYDLEMHFIAPYATAFCKWRYVLVPFFHIFALAAPKSDVNNSQYSSPYLIRAFSKGYFNIEMGMIESLTWKRFGDGDMISEDGVPTQIDVSVSLKDLYHTLAMTNLFDNGEGFTNVGNFMNNTGLMDLIGTLSGVNMNRISIGERISMFISSGTNAFGALGGNFMRSISDRVRNISGSLNLYGV